MVLSSLSERGDLFAGAEELFERHAGVSSVLEFGNGPLHEILHHESLPNLVQAAVLPPFHEAKGRSGHKCFAHDISLITDCAMWLAAIAGGALEELAQDESLRPDRVFSAKQTQVRRRQRFREAVVDIVVGDLGWLSITMIEIQGMWGWQRTFQQGAVSSGSRGRIFFGRDVGCWPCAWLFQISVHAAAGVPVCVQSPLMPFEASGTKPQDWSQ